VHVRHRRARWLGLAVVVPLAFSACSAVGGEPVSVTTPNGQVAPTAVPSTEDSSAPETNLPAPNDLKNGRVTRSLKTGRVNVKVKYSLRNRVQRWSPGVPQPLTVSMTAVRQQSTGQYVAPTDQKIYLSRVTAYLDVSDATGSLDSPDPLVDRAEITPGFLITSPSSYTQVFVLPALPAEAISLTIDFRYEMLVLQPQSTPRDFAKRTATDTLVISRP
jgi:hypothetical protein